MLDPFLAPRVLFFDEPGGVSGPLEVVTWLQEHSTSAVVLYDRAVVQHLFSLLAPEVPLAHLSYTHRQEPVPCLSISEHTAVLEGYIEVLKDAVYHLKQSKDLLLISTCSYLQEYACHVYLCQTLSLKEKVSLLTHYRQEHRRLLKDIISLRVLVHTERDPGHYFSREGIQHRVTKELYVQDLFTHQDTVANTSQAGEYLLSRYTL